MGGVQAKQVIYALPISEPVAGETAIYRHKDFKGNLLSSPEPGVLTYTDILKRAFKRFGNHFFLGWREVIEDGSLDKCYTWETYSEIEDFGKYIGSGLYAKGLIEEKAQYQDYSLKFVSIYSKNNREWILIDVASALYGLTLVPIYDTLGEEATQVMFEETETSTICLTCDHVKSMLTKKKAGMFEHLKNFIIMDERNLNDELLNLLKDVNFYKLSEIIEAGKAQPKEYAQVKPDDICFFSYTSGTTGRPKGAMISHKNITAAVAGAHALIPEFEMKHISYLPLAHVFERVVLSLVIFRGGRYAMYGGDVRKIIEDVKILQPTIFVSVPRMFSKIFDEVQGIMRNSGKIKRMFASRAVKAKLRSHKNSGKNTHFLYDMLVFNKIKKGLGGKVQYCLTGSAPMSSEIREFLKIAFGCGFAEGYGQTEGMAGEFLTAEDDNTFGHVGGPIPQNEFKLIDVPEMKYLSTDKDEKGRLAPRGEILIRGGNVIPGYYKNPEKTSESIDEHGWLHSGDVGMIMPGSGALKIIDRVKNIFKLPIGEYVAPDRLEQAYKSTRGISDLFVYGETTKDLLIGVVYSEPKDLKSIALELGLTGEYEELCKNPAINKYFMDALFNKNKELKLAGFERINQLYVDPVSFEAHGLLTTTYKLKRHEASDHYSEILKELYVKIEESQKNK